MYVIIISHRTSLIVQGEFHFLNYETKRSHVFYKTLVTKVKWSDVFVFRPKFSSLWRLRTRYNENFVNYEVFFVVDTKNTL